MNHHSARDCASKVYRSKFSFLWNESSDGAAETADNRALKAGAVTTGNELEEVSLSWSPHSKDIDSPHQLDIHCE